jgi:hypothetical protein
MPALDASGADGSITFSVIIPVLDRLDGHTRTISDDMKKKPPDNERENIFDERRFTELRIRYSAEKYGNRETKRDSVGMWKKQRPHHHHESRRLTGDANPPLLAIHANVAEPSEVANQPAQAVNTFRVQSQRTQTRRSGRARG